GRAWGGRTASCSGSPSWARSRSCSPWRRGSAAARKPTSSGSSRRPAACSCPSPSCSTSRAARAWACTSIRTASCSSRSRPPPAGSRGRSAPIGSGSARPRRRSPSWACGSSRARWGRGSPGRRRSGVCSSRSRSTFSSSGSGSRAARAARLRPPSSRASASTSMAEPWPWLAGSAGLAALLIRHATFPPREFLHLVAALGMGVALAEVESVHGRQLGFPPPSVYFAVLLGAALAFQLVALARRAPAARRMAEYAAAGLAALLLLARVPVPGAPLPPLWLFHGTTLALGVLVALSATRLGSGPGVLGATLATALAQSGWTWALRGPGETTPLLLQGAAVLLFTAWPFLAGVRFRTDRFAWYGAALWVRLDYPGLKYFGWALLCAVTVRLVANPAVLGYYPRPAFRIVNWLLYTYLVPAAALLGTAALLHPRELVRARGWERERLYQHGLPAGALGAGLAALVVIFVWINLAIADWFATGPMLRVSFERLPARDLTTSPAWAGYALVLLAIRRSRRTSSWPRRAGCRA